jgi:hypothetical protein
MGLTWSPEIKTFGLGCRTYSDDERRRSGLPPVGLIQQAARERRSARVIAYTDANFSTNAALKMCPQLKNWVLVASVPRFKPFCAGLDAHFLAFVSGA